MAYKMKGHSLPGINQRKSPAKHTLGNTARISQQQADKHNSAPASGSHSGDPHKEESPAKQGVIWDENSAAELSKMFPPRKEKLGEKIKDKIKDVRVKARNKQATRIATRHSRAVEKGKDKKVVRLEKKMERKGIETPEQHQARYSPKESYTGSKTAYSRRTKNDLGQYNIEPKKKKSPAKCPLIAALPAITAGISAIGAMKKKKEE